ncbi:MAG: rod shape-determining protein MreC [Coriobacteriia bacterium]|nr:rod shape-determining protein MreC [Coriobacteriia bacterium]
MKISQSERPGRGTALLAVLVVVSLALTTVYFREGDRGVLHRSRVAVQAITAPVSAVGDFAFSPVRAFSAWVGGFGVSRGEAQALRDQNAQLRTRVAELEEARLENERLSRLLGFVEAGELDAVGARVIGRPATAWEGTLLIDRGTRDGVEVGMPVLAPEGLLGQTVEVTERSAKVRLITDQRSGVAGILQPTRAEGIISGSIDGRLSMDFVSREITVTVGDVVLTSGMGGVYPKGLLIGEVSSFSLQDNDLFPKIGVRPSARFAGIEEVIVLTGAPPQPEIGGGE